MALPPTAIRSRLASLAPCSFPRTLDKIERLILADAPESLVRAVLGTDPMLTAQVLGHANAAGGTPVTRLSEAMRGLGLGTVLGLVRQVEPVPGPERALLGAAWSCAQAGATMLRLVAAQCAPALPRPLDNETLHACGLLHDLGSVVAMLHFPGPHGRALARTEAGEGSYQRLLKEELGMDGAELGGLLANLWHLPQPLPALLRSHLAPSRAAQEPELAAMMHVARVLIRALGHAGGADRWVDAVEEQALLLLRLRLDDLETLLDRFLAEMQASELYEALIDG